MNRRTVFGRPFVKRFALCYQTVICLSVCDVGVLWPNGWMDQDETWHAGRPRPWPHSGHIVLDGDPAPPAKGVQQPPLFLAHVYCGHGRPSQLLLSSCSVAYFRNLCTNQPRKVREPVAASEAVKRCQFTITQFRTKGAPSGPLQVACKL